MSWILQLEQFDRGRLDDTAYVQTYLTELERCFTLPLSPGGKVREAQFPNKNFREQVSQISFNNLLVLCALAQRIRPATDSSAEVSDSLPDKLLKAVINYLCCHQLGMTDLQIREASGEVKDPTAETPAEIVNKLQHILFNVFRGLDNPLKYRLPEYYPEFQAAMTTAIARGYAEYRQDLMGRKQQNYRAKLQARYLKRNQQRFTLEWGYSRYNRSLSAKPDLALRHNKLWQPTGANTQHIATQDIARFRNLVIAGEYQNPIYGETKKSDNYHLCVAQKLEGLSADPAVINFLKTQITNENTALKLNASCRNVQDNLTRETLGENLLIIPQTIAFKKENDNAVSCRVVYYLFEKSDSSHADTQPLMAFDTLYHISPTSTGQVKLTVENDYDIMFNAKEVWEIARKPLSTLGLTYPSILRRAWDYIRNNPVKTAIVAIGGGVGSAAGVFFAPVTLTWLALAGIGLLGGVIVSTVIGKVHCLFDRSVPEKQPAVPALPESNAQEKEKIGHAVVAKMETLEQTQTAIQQIIQRTLAKDATRSAAPHGGGKEVPDLTTWVGQKTQAQRHGIVQSEHPSFIAGVPAPASTPLMPPSSLPLLPKASPSLRPGNGGGDG